MALGAVVKTVSSVILNFSSVAVKIINARANSTLMNIMGHVIEMLVSHTVLTYRITIL